MPQVLRVGKLSIYDKSMMSFYWGMGMHKKTFAFSLLVVLALGASPALADCEGDPPYSSRWAGFTTSTQAAITSEALGEAGEFLAGLKEDANGQDGDGAVLLQIEARLGYTRAIVGGYAQSALRSVASHYFCQLRLEYPSKSSELKKAELRYLRYLQFLFNPGLWRESRDATRLDEIIARQESTAKFSRVLTSQEVESALDDVNFTRTTAIEGSISVALPGVGAADACTGTLFRSLNIVDSRVLNALEFVRSSLIGFLEGGLEAELGLLYVTDLPFEMHAEFTGDGGAYDTLSLDQILCVENARERIDKYIEVDKTQTPEEDDNTNSPVVSDEQPI